MGVGIVDQVQLHGFKCVALPKKAFPKQGYTRREDDKENIHDYTQYLHRFLWPQGHQQVVGYRGRIKPHVQCVHCFEHVPIEIQPQCRQE